MKKHYAAALTAALALIAAACSTPLEGVGIKPEAPAAPVLTRGNGSLTVSWAEVERAESYKVYLSTGAAVPAEPARVTAERSTAFAGLVNETAYHVWIQAVNARGDSPLSEAAQATLSLAAPGDVTLAAGNGSLRVSWTANEFADSYDLYYSAGTTPPAEPAQTGITGTDAVIGGLVNDTTYYVWVRSVDQGGASALSEAAQAILSLAAPGDVMLSAGNGSLTVSWTANEFADSYDLYYSAGTTPPAEPAQTGITGTDAVIGGLVNDTAYYVWVRSVDQGGASALSEAAQAILSLAAPGDVMLSAGNGSLTVSWTANEFADSYDLYYSAGTTPPAEPAQTGITGTSAVIGGLVNDTAYYVWVRSVDQGGASALSEAAQATLSLAAPGDVRLAAGNGSLTVSWTANEFADSYDLYYGDNETPPAEPAQTGITGTSAVIGGLVNDTAYAVWVRSVNQGGASALSEAAQASLSLAAPGKLTLTTGNGSLRVSWTAVEFADSYNLYHGDNQTLPAEPAQTGITGTDAAIGGLTGKTACYVWVQAVNKGGSSLVSAPAAWSRKLSFTAVDAASYTQAITAINADGIGGAYTITVANLFSCAALSFTANAVKTITIQGDAPYTISNTANDNFFTLPEGISLVLGNNLSLNGNTKGYSVVRVSGGTLTMKAGSTVLNANAPGVSLSGGQFIMEGGTISGNTAASGGGVALSGGSFSMSGGTISGNKATHNGGGVYVSGGSFSMSGGTISGNTASSGGGVYVGGGSFSKNGGGTIDAANSAPTGKAAYVDVGRKVRNTAAGPELYMDSNVVGSAGGWE